MSFRLTFGLEPALRFEAPQEIVRARHSGDLTAALGRCEAALNDGWWIAGYLAYSGEAALGIFAAPQPIALPDPKAVCHAPLLATVPRAAYDAAIASLQRAIYDGDVYQVNYTVPFAFSYEGDPFELYAWYARLSGACYQAYVEDGARAIASWSPELFLAFDGERVRTKPMKGTAALDRADELEQPKNRAEHVMIVDLLRNDLHRFCRDVTVERFLEIERYPTYATMTSTIAGTPRPKTSLAEIFAATFPCGSITGAPKRAAMRFIAESEPMPRGAYCGTIGFLSPQRRGWWNVAIRTAQLDLASRTGRYDTGGGIVADSRAASEWSEVLLKSRFLRPNGTEAFAVLETFAADAGDDTVERHLARLQHSAERFGIPYSKTRARAVLSAARGAAQPHGTIVRVRLTIDGEFHVTTQPAGTPEEPVLVCLSAQRVRSADPFLQHKTSWRPAHDAALREAVERDCFDALLRNERDELTEGARTNLFVERAGALLTPPLSSGVLPGIWRAWALSTSRAREAILTLRDVTEAETLYVANSARGLLRAVLIA